MRTSSVPQRRVHKERTWKDNWNDVMRYVLFPDERLRSLLCLPQDVTIAQFRDKYFTKGHGTTNEILTNEKVRVIWYDSEGRDTGNRRVKNKYKEFDIYVKQDVLFNATQDRLQYRYDLIAERLKELLCGSQYVGQMRFEMEDEYDVWTKTAGYTLYHVSFSYKVTA